MCSSGHCFSEEEKEKLREKGWDKYHIDFVEDSVVEDKIKELIK